jgi:hypothetical protein
MRHDLIPIDQRDDWNRALFGLSHGFGHTWESCHAYWLTNRLPTYLYVFQGDSARIVCPLIVRGSNGQSDVSTPFGFSGFAGIGHCSNFRDEWLKFARSRGWVCAYIGQNPQFHPERYWELEDFQLGQKLFWLDLEQTDAELVARLSRGRRRPLKRWTSMPDWLCTDRSELVEFILANHEDFFRRVGATRSYAFTEATWRALAACSNVELLGARLNGRLVAITLFGYAGKYADALFNISIQGGRDAATALMMEGARRLGARGMQLLNMGGGVRPGDELEASKRQYNGIVRPLLHMKHVLDSGTFATLCHRAGADPSDLSSYFPPYHRTCVI